ncbi:hypothetical protein EV44_g2270 [Erysiphe necator]|uniref:Uncharacterized protein n=1 Tax=Uncinula necator TaxID=52586 RepID=A0A0B1P2U4_UNCNE|nr:hypothetical protein EV44_g2270 [Erysiphe necator]
MFHSSFEPVFVLDITQLALSRRKRREITRDDAKRVLSCDMPKNESLFMLTKLFSETSELETSEVETSEVETSEVDTSKVEISECELLLQTKLGA